MNPIIHALWKQLHNPIRTPPRNPASQPDGIEVKLNLSKTAVCEILLFFLAMFASSALYIYIWEEFSSFNWGHFIGLHYGKSVLQLLLAIVGLYILLYSLLTGNPSASSPPVPSP